MGATNEFRWRGSVVPWFVVIWVKAALARGTWQEHREEQVCGVEIRQAFLPSNERLFWGGGNLACRFPKLRPCSSPYFTLNEKLPAMRAYGHVCREMDSRLGIYSCDDIPTELQWLHVPASSVVLIILLLV